MTDKKESAPEPKATPEPTPEPPPELATVTSSDVGEQTETKASKAAKEGK